jgi:hypothetical protein
MDEEMVAISVGEYEHLKQCRDSLQKHYSEQMQDTYNDMQTRMTDAIVRHDTQTETPNNGIKRLATRIGNNVYEWVNRSIPVVIGIAVFGIVCAVMGYYLGTRFHIGWFLGFELPLYLFLLWAVCSVWRMYRNYKKEKRI